jgi:hypothetical protein
MKYEPFSSRATRARLVGPGMVRPWAALAILLVGPAAFAQTPPPSGEVVPAYAQSIINGTDGGVIQAGCPTCGSSLPAPYLTGPIAGGCGTCACSDDSCGSCQCKPGKVNNCYCNGCSDSFLGRLGGGFIQCICCPDPCYEGFWDYTANAAFFQDTVRPQTYTRLRWDSGVDVRQPDRAEFMWAKPGVLGGRGPTNIETHLNYDTLSLYQEIAAGNFALFVNAPYVGVDPDNNPGHSNFGDVDLGTKTLLIDCDLMQLTFQFRTYIPAGISRNGLGTGHTTLEPSLLMSIKVMSDTYLQMQGAYWIPIGGDQDWEGATWWYGASLNHQWFNKGPFRLISTAEVNGWTFTDGAVAIAPIAGGPTPSTSNAASFTAHGEDTYVTMGGGMRLVICDKYDIGFGSSFAVTSGHFADQLYRTEFRVKW